MRNNATVSHRSVAHASGEPLTSLGREEKLLMGHVEVIDSTELAKRLNVPETWVRSQTSPKRTSDPIPHFKLGRYVRFPWGSEHLHEWLNRQLVSTNGQGH